MNLIKKIGLSLVIVFIIIQFIQPGRNKSEQVPGTDITKLYNVPGDVRHILVNACYDCHSNNTRYPWYTYIQPVGWMLAKHIRDGNADLNFSEFGKYTKRRQMSKLMGIANSIKDGSMPLSSYTLIHKDARLTTEEKKSVITWASNTKDSITRWR